MFTGYENKMMTDHKTKQIKINKPLRNHNVGDVVLIKVDSHGVPLERYWRDRLKDSKTDKCIEFVKGKK